MEKVVRRLVSSRSVFASLAFNDSRFVFVSLSHHSTLTVFDKCLWNIKVMIAKRQYLWNVIVTYQGAPCIEINTSQPEVG